MQDLDFEAGVWAVVMVSGGKKIIGGMPDLNKKDAIEAIEKGWILTVNPAFELLCTHMPVQDGQGNVGFRHLVQCLPIDGCKGPAKIHVVAESIHFFEDMQESDRNEHKKLVEALAEMLVAARLTAAGIVKPTLTGAHGPLRS